MQAKCEPEIVVLLCTKCLQVTNIANFYPVVTNKDLFFEECRARLACTYAQSDLALHASLFNYQLLSINPRPMSIN